MPFPIIMPTDLPEGIRGGEMCPMWVEGANAQAQRVAPCLASIDHPPTSGQLSEARLILAGAVIRWSQAGSGAVQSESAGPYGITVDTRQPSGYNLRPSEITQLQDICKNGSEKQAFAIDTAPRHLVVHAEICSVRWGGPCSCGADIAGEALYC